MKRLHVNVSVDDLDRSIAFYATLFGAEPSVRKDDYAKWMLDDPQVNFAIAARGRKPGLDHLGIQTETETELAEIAGRLNAAGDGLIAWKTNLDGDYNNNELSYVESPCFDF